MPTTATVHELPTVRPSAPDLDRETCGHGVRACVCGQCRCRECWEQRAECECTSAAPVAAPKPCDSCESAYHAAAPTRGWCSSCAPDGVLIGELCACGCARLLEGEDCCEECACLDAAQ